MLQLYSLSMLNDNLLETLKKRTKYFIIVFHTTVYNISIQHI